MAMVHKPLRDDPTPPTCSNCQFRLDAPYKLEDGQEGVNSFCRRYPPHTLAAHQSAFPPVGGDMWCGEWKKGKVS